MVTNKAHDGNPYVGNPQAWFDERKSHRRQSRGVGLCPHKKIPLVYGMLIAFLFLPTIAECSFDWSAHIDGWDRFVENYEKYRKAERQYISATNDIARVSIALTAIDKENPFKNSEDLKIGEFEEIDQEMSLEDVREDEEREADDDDAEDDEI